MKLDTLTIWDIDFDNDRNHSNQNLYYLSKVSENQLLNDLDAIKEFHNHWFPEAPINLSSKKLISNYVMKEIDQAYDSLTAKTYDSKWTLNIIQEPVRSSFRYVDYVDDLISEFETAKNWRKEIFSEFAIRGTLWFIIALSFLLWIVSLVRWQQMLITAIVVALSPILIAIIGVTLFGLLDVDDAYIMPLITFTYFVFFVQAIYSLFQTKINSYKNVITILVTFFFPLTPIAIIAWIWDTYKWQYYHNSQLILGYDYETFNSLLLTTAEITTFVFVFVAMVIFTPILKKHFALPKNN